MLGEDYQRRVCWLSQTVAARESQPTKLSFGQEVRTAGLVLLRFLLQSTDSHSALGPSRQRRSVPGVTA